MAAPAPKDDLFCARMPTVEQTSILTPDGTEDRAADVAVLSVENGDEDQGGAIKIFRSAVGYAVAVGRLAFRPRVRVPCAGRHRRDEIALRPASQRRRQRPPPGCGE